jgi:hypothetical protein
MNKLLIRNLRDTNKTQAILVQCRESKGHDITSHCTSSEDSEPYRSQRDDSTLMVKKFTRAQ